MGQQVGLILACAVAHDRDGLCLGVGDASELDGLHAPGLWMVLPVTVAPDASTGSRARSW